MPSRYVTSHPRQLSLAIRPWVGTMNTSENWDINNRHTARCTSHVSVVTRQCKVVFGRRLRERRSAPPFGSYGMPSVFATLLYNAATGAVDVQMMQMVAMVYSRVKCRPVSLVQASWPATLSVPFCSRLVHFLLPTCSLLLGYLL